MNVLLELGYFLGTLRRTSGRVVVLRKGDVEIPSDLAGVVYIDISGGVQAAAPEIIVEFSSPPSNKRIERTPRALS